MQLSCRNYFHLALNEDLGIKRGVASGTSCKLLIEGVRGPRERAGHWVKACGAGLTD